MANLNINSLLKHIDEIRISLTDNPFDILAINETKLDSSISIRKFIIIITPSFVLIEIDLEVVWLFI